MTTYTLYSIVDEAEATYSSIVEFTPDEDWGMIYVEIAHCKMYGSEMMTVEAARELWCELRAAGYGRFGDKESE